MPKSLFVAQKENVKTRSEKIGKVLSVFLRSFLVLIDDVK